MCHFVSLVAVLPNTIRQDEESGVSAAHEGHRKWEPAAVSLVSPFPSLFPSSSLPYLLLIFPPILSPALPSPHLYSIPSLLFHPFPFNRGAIISLISRGHCVMCVYTRPYIEHCRAESTVHSPSLSPSAAKASRVRLCGCFDYVLYMLQ